MKSKAAAGHCTRLVYYTLVRVTAAIADLSLPTFEDTTVFGTTNISDLTTNFKYYWFYLKMHCNISVTKKYGRLSAYNGFLLIKL